MKELKDILIIAEMTTKEIKYPQNYIPVNRLVICSNTLIGGGNIIGFDDFPPLLIGKGTVPKLWVYAKDRHQKWTPIINESRSLHPAIIIKSDDITREILAKIDNATLIRAKMSDDNSCLVDQIDLRPIGLNLFGNETVLTIGTSNFSGNTFQGVRFMIGVSDK